MYHRDTENIEPRERDRPVLAHSSVEGDADQVTEEEDAAPGGGGEDDEPGELSYLLRLGKYEASIYRHRA